MAVAPPGVPRRLPISIGNHAYVIDVPKYRRSVVDQLRQPTDQGDEPGEQSFNTQGLWKRSQSDWSLGAGQQYLDTPQESTRRRFRSSLGLDPWTRHQLTLLPKVEAKTGGPATGATLMQSLGTRLYVASGTNLHFTSDASPTAPVWSVIAVGSSVLDFTTDGNNVYIATTAGIYKVALGTTVLGAVWAAGSYATVRYANGRLLAASATVLSEISSTGTATAIKTLTFSGFVWTGITSAPGAVYAWASSNDVTEIYSIGVSDTTGALTAPIYAGGLPIGETLNVMEHYGGIMILGTTIGVRLATIGGRNDLSYGPAIKAGSVRDLDQRGQFCWFTWSAYDATHCGLGRVDLSKFVEEQVPAHATDLMAPLSQPVQATAWHGGRHYFTVVGVGLYGETLEKVDSGELNTGFIRYGNYERKILSSMDVRTDPLAGEVVMHAHLENSNHISIASHNEQGSLSLAQPATIQGGDGESVEIHLVFNRSTTVPTTGPILRRWTLRIMPAPTVVEEFILPIIMADTVQTDGPFPDQHYIPLDEYTYLLGLVNSKTVVRYQEGAASYVVYVSKVEIQPDKWNKGVKAFEGIYAVRLITIQPGG